ncbi:hypothetical protein Tco_0833717 [Tanacetum coccineum]
MTSRPRHCIPSARRSSFWGCDRLVSRAKVIENQVVYLGLVYNQSWLLLLFLFRLIHLRRVWVILFGAISVIILDLVDYSPSSDYDPSEDSLPPAPDLPLVSPFLCSDDSKADGESDPAEQRPVSSYHDALAPLSEFPLAPTLEAAPLSTPYPPTTSKSSLGSSSERFDNTLLLLIIYHHPARGLGRFILTRGLRRGAYGVDTADARGCADVVYYIERDWIDSIRWHMELSQEEFHQVHRDRDDTRWRLRRLESNVED